MNVKIATAPCSWGVWYADGTPSGTPADVFLNQAEEAGYTALELGPIGYLPTDTEILKEELDKRRLSICAGTVCQAFDQFRSFKDFKPAIAALCNRLQKLDVPYIVAMDESNVGKYSELKKTMPRETWVGYIQMIKEMAEFTKQEYGIEILYHPHIKSLVEYENEIVDLMDIANVNLCFDTGHHAYCNGGYEIGDRSALAFLEKYADRIPYLHFKNVDPVVRKKVIDENIDSDTAFDIDVMCDLKDGIIDFKQLTDLLRKIHFDGYAVIEQDVPHATVQQAFESAKRNLEYLRSIGMIQ